MGDNFIEIHCEHCSACFVIPENYAEPYAQCPECGSHQKMLHLTSSEPKYKILDQAGRQRARLPVAQPAAVTSAVSSAEIPSGKIPGRHIAEPVLVPAEVKAAAVAAAATAKAARIDHKILTNPVNEKKLLEDSLGKAGMEMVLQLVAGYLGELSETKRRAEKTRVMQTLMRSKFPAELAARAVEFAEKSPEIHKILLNNYQASLKRGLIIFFAGAIISAGVHFLANPGRELVLFQLPFAVGLALAVNAGINMAGLKIPALRSNFVHYGFLTAVVLIIASYIAWGIFF